MYTNYSVFKKGMLCGELLIGRSKDLKSKYVLSFESLKRGHEFEVEVKLVTHLVISAHESIPDYLVLQEAVAKLFGHPGFEVDDYIIKPDHPAALRWIERFSSIK